MCDAPVETYSRVAGFFRPVQQWNLGKRAEFADRKPYRLSAAFDAEPAPTPTKAENVAQAANQGAL